MPQKIKKEKDVYLFSLEGKKDVEIIFPNAWSNGTKLGIHGFGDVYFKNLGFKRKLKIEDEISVIDLDFKNDWTSDMDMLNNVSNNWVLLDSEKGLGCTDDTVYRVMRYKFDNKEVKRKLVYCLDNIEEDRKKYIYYDSKKLSIVGAGCHINQPLFYAVNNTLLEDESRVDFMLELLIFGHSMIDLSKNNIIVLCR